MAPTAESQRRALIVQRGTCKSQLTRYKTFIDNFGNHNDLERLQIRIAAVEDAFTQFKQVQTELEILDDTDTQQSERELFEEDYFLYLARGNVLKKELQLSNASTASPPSSVRESSEDPHRRSMNLPSLNLPKFGGLYREWPGFVNQFESMVHNDTRLSDADKLVYLRSCLVGEAANVIRSVDNSEENYTVAWAMLRKRFHNPAVIVANHVSAIFDIPTLRKTSHRDLRHLASEAEVHYRSLQKLNQPSTDTLLIHILKGKLDSDTAMRWKESRPSAFPTIDEFFDFINARCNILEPSTDTVSEPLLKDLRLSHHSQGPRLAPINQGPRISYNHPTRAHVAQTRIVCSICKAGHVTRNCTQLLHATVSERVALVQAGRLCYNCLRPGHMVKECKSAACTKCGQAHHTLLHFDEGIAHDTQVTQSHDTQATQSHLTTLNTVTTHTHNDVLLATAVVLITDKDGKSQPCRMLLDSGSQSHFLTDTMAKRLGLRRNTVNIPLTGINQVTSHITHSISADMRSRINSFSETLTFMIIPRVTEALPSRFIHRSRLEVPSNIPLADPAFNKPGEIDGILGAGIYYRLLSIGQLASTVARVTFQKTKLGWIISGELNDMHSRKPTVVCNMALDSLHTQISKFWEVEEGPSVKLLSPEEQRCEAYYAATTHRVSETGRYIVRLPFKENPEQLGDSYTAALKRFYSLERSLDRKPEIKKEYSAFLDEYLRLGHMSRVESAPTHEGYYLPHHAVIKDSSTTTKLRVVFDASARSSSGTSLNDIIMTGPTIQDDIFSLISRFRLHKFVLTADITKMYRQILVDTTDSDFQKILWREHSNQPIATYKLNTVTYGTSSAPFLAVRTLHKLAEDEGLHYPRAARILTQDFYVDDLLTGAHTIEEATEIRDELIKITQRGGFELRKWASNDPSLVPRLPSSSQTKSLSLGEDNTTKTLGIFWNRERDCIGFTIKQLQAPQRITKRSILSQIAQLFDPLGLLGPVIVKAKLIMQELWQCKLDWDESVSAHLHTAWLRYREELHALNSFYIPRRLLVDDPINIELHGFSDASERAYGACLYLRSTDASGQTVSALVNSKSRVAPLKSLSLPRLELCAAVLLVKLYKATTQALKTSFNRVVFWCDSTITLQWIATPPHTLKTFVSNRVSEIQRSSSPGDWRHVCSEDNPADLISRGLSPIDFIDNRMWQRGPHWLTLAEEAWPQTNLSFRETNEDPEKRVTVALPSITASSDIITRHSSLTKLKRVVAYCLRFAHNARKGDKYTGSLTARELRTALTTVLRMTQKEFFAEELHCLTHNKSLPRSSKLLSLNPFLDSDGVLRVGGRLIRANLPYAKKHHIVLPQKHHLTELIITHAHITHQHAGAQATLNAVRQEYWPINGPSSVKGLVHNCVTCYRARPKIPEYCMGQLPRNRVTFTRPFLSTGVDYCGPFFIKEKRYRNRSKIKVFVAVFVCLSTRAIHLEIVSDLTTDAFLAALRRFFARRGKAADIYSDNATNFTGANREIRDIQSSLSSSLSDEKTARYLADSGIRWHFIPPRAPHFGGLWEAAVKSLKQHMVRVIGDTLFSYEELFTYVAEVEAILNSRPLTPISTDPNDLATLTPAHFLIGDSLTSMPEHNLTDTPPNRLSSWQHIQRLRQHFWTRWHKEYLHQLTVRKKWHTDGSSGLKIGVLVILREDNAPPRRWKLGRVIDIHPGEDGVIRVVTVKTHNGTYKRSVKGLSPLPVDTAN